MGRQKRVKKGLQSERVRYMLRVLKHNTSSLLIEIGFCSHLEGQVL